MNSSIVQNESDISLKDFIDSLELKGGIESQDYHGGRDIWNYISGLISGKDKNKSERRIKTKDREALLSILESITEIISTIGENDENLSDKLSLCQEAAIAVGENIESLFGEGDEIVSRLESFCEDLFKYLEDQIHDPKSLTSKVEEIINLIKSLPKKYLAVFLPYNFTMWDCFESVWKESLGDSLWESMVIPIPYFERDENGNPSEAHYDGPFYIEENPPVPIFSFSEISLSDEKPDVIFYHNPYDNYNYVSMVHPDYFCKNLRGLGAMLVYIPYYMPINDYTGEGLICSPGVVYADKVMLHSEKLKARFVKVFTDWLKESGANITDSDIDKKFSVFKTPKLDRLFNGSYSLENIPDEWKSKILTGDKRKKILLFDSHLNLLYSSKSNAFKEKMERIIEEFSKREDAVLLWRPHPLSQETIKSANPDFYDEYMDLVERVKNAPWGILDDTKDMYTAIVISDGAYNSWGSIFEIYKYTGKPGLIIDLSK